MYSDVGETLKDLMIPDTLIPLIFLVQEKICDRSRLTIVCYPGNLRSVAVKPNHLEVDSEGRKLGRQAPQQLLGVIETVSTVVKVFPIRVSGEKYRRDDRV
tara:strand:- start:251 stop:553 length:303 start_codon:yes stop_codon:yes gene_type:complete